MNELIKNQFVVIRASIRTLDQSRTRSDLRKNQMLLKVWNNTFKWLEDQAQTEWDKSICLMYYGMLSDRQARLLSWDEFKKLTDMILKGDVLL